MGKAGYCLLVNNFWPMYIFINDIVLDFALHHNSLLADPVGNLLKLLSQEYFKTPIVQGG